MDQRRGRGRPRKVLTGRVGRPRKYQADDHVPRGLSAAKTKFVQPRTAMTTRSSRRQEEEVPVDDDEDEDDHNHAMNIDSDSTDGSMADPEIDRFRDDDHIEDAPLPRTLVHGKRPRHESSPQGGSPDLAASPHRNKRNFVDVGDVEEDSPWVRGLIANTPKIGRDDPFDFEEACTAITAALGQIKSAEQAEENFQRVFSRFLAFEVLWAERFSPTRGLKGTVTV